MWMTLLTTAGRGKWDKVNGTIIALRVSRDSLLSNANTTHARLHGAMDTSEDRTEELEGKY